jgi:hypothetical protein
MADRPATLKTLCYLCLSRFYGFEFVFGCGFVALCFEFSGFAPDFGCRPNRGRTKASDFFGNFFPNCPSCVQLGTVVIVHEN